MSAQSVAGALPHPLAPEQRAVTGRDLGWLCGCLVFVMAPHAMRIPWWLTVLAVCLFSWRTYLALTQRKLPSSWLLIGVAALGIAAIGIEYRTLFGRASGIALLMMLAGLKLLEMRSHRDATMVVFLCYFLVLTNFLFTQSIPTALVMCAALVAITGALVSFSAPQRAPVANLRTAGLLLLHAIPIAAVLFVLFPRVQGPLWGMPQDAYSGITGLSDTMSPGTLSQLSISDAVAFRVLFKGRSPSPRQLYWRGPVLWDFDGLTWRTGPRRLRAPDEVTGGEARYDYTVVLEPHNRNWLFALETAASLPRNSWLSSDGQVMSYTEIRNRMRYEMTSVAGGRRVDTETPGSLARAKLLPTGFNPRAVALGQSWRRSISDDEALMNHAITWLRDQRFVYTLLPPALGRNSVDEFLFDTKRGFCEHFSSAFVFLMRAAGVPARVVTGYQGGDFNPLDGYITVRQAEAHAWAEVFVEQRGWVRVDPTAVSMPGRVDSGMANSVPSGDPVPYLMRLDSAWLKSLRYNWEALSNQWNLWVLGYNTERQRELLNRMGFTDADWRQLSTMLVSAIGAIMIALLAWSLKRLVRPDPVQRLWLAFCRKLAASGLPRAPHEGPRDFTGRAALRFPAAATAILQVGELYMELRYGTARTRDAIADLKRTVRELRPHMKRLFVCAFAACNFLAWLPNAEAAPPHAVDAPSYANRPEVRDFIRGMVEHHGFTEHELRALFAQVRRQPEILKAIRPPLSPRTRSWANYRPIFVNDRHVAEGLRFFAENAPALTRAEREYGVPAEIIVAIIGVETFYGRNMGKWRVADALATLAFDYPPRADYFRSELESFLLFTREARLDALSVRGSYAGAIGIPQFMPRSYRLFAVDFDGDGTVLLRSSPTDAIGSVANFLRMHGWVPGEPIVYPADVGSADPAPLVAEGLKPAHTLAEFDALGITVRAEPAARPGALGALIDLVTPDKPTEYRVGLDNFYVITRYNRSSFYAAAVNDLAQALRQGRKP